MAQTSPLTARLEAVTKAGGFDPAVVRRFELFLDSSPEEELFRMSPMRYAEQAGVDVGVAIDLFVHAAAAGALEMSWGVLCPGCRAFLATAEGMRKLADERRCNFCQVPVTSALEDNVEVAFTISPKVRRIRFHDPDKLSMDKDGLRLAFSASALQKHPMVPWFEEHGLRAEQLRPGEDMVVETVFAEDNYAVVEPATHAALHFSVREGGDRKARVDLLDGHMVPDRVALGTAGATLTITNRTKRTANLGLYLDPSPPPEERTPGVLPPPIDMDPYLNGKQLITRQSFRDLFQSASVPAGGGLQLKNLSVLFTDLKSSTEMYERIGDLSAYDLVRRHFDVLQDVVARHGGGIVKTIGDAIMAGFPEPAPAMRAAAEMRTAVPGVDPDERLALKIGVHTGPCIAVDLNERLDYFGRTVNIAARVQGAAAGDEIVCTLPVFDAPGVAALASDAGLVASNERLTLKGIDEPVPVVRLNAA